VWGTARDANENQSHYRPRPNDNDYHYYLNYFLFFVALGALVVL
jgi:hypothetical protein